MMSPPMIQESKTLVENKLAAADPGTLAVEPVTDINEKALVRKIDSRLLPALTVLYLCSFLDRSNGE